MQADIPPLGINQENLYNDHIFHYFLNLRISFMVDFFLTSEYRENPLLNLEFSVIINDIPKKGHMGIFLYV